MDENETQESQESLQPEIPWLKRVSAEEATTPPDPDFIAMLEELEFR